MDKFKRYIECFIPVTACTLRCHYCYITQHRLFDTTLPSFEYSPEHCKRALSKERLGGICIFNMCGAGETLLPPQLPKYLKAILEEGHYITLVTNATVSKRFDEIAAFGPELCKRLFFKFSFHYLEFKKKNLMDRFFSNIEKMRDAGCSYTIEITPNDELIPYIDEIKELCMERMGALAHITIARDERVEDVIMLSKMNKKEFMNTWGVFDSELLKFKMPIFGQKRKEFCYAGDWSFFLNLGTGIMRQCYCSYHEYNILKNPEKPIPFHAIGNRCSLPHCWNAHSYLNFGVIPEMHIQTNYAQMRNRIPNNGTREWLTPEFKNMFTQKLSDNNQEYSAFKKWKINMDNDMDVLFNRIKGKFKSCFSPKK